MSSSPTTQSHPRRRPIKASTPPLSTHGMQLRKSSTFSSPKSDSSDLCGLENHQYMPRRSPTSTESLEELLRDSSVRRVANILKDFDQKIAGHKSSATTTAGTAGTGTGTTTTTTTTSTNILSDPEVLPVPSFILDNATLEAANTNTSMDIDPKPKVENTSHDHASDSGLGSSISSSKSDGRSACESMTTSVASTHSAITRSFSALGAADEKHTLGEYACKQIHDHIIKPILAEESLKDFHPLIKDVPRRIGEKNICNLRDLEKTLIFLAPELSATPASYLQFCERSIQLLNATVDCLPEQDQRLPSDRPYTNNYFLDLIEQIRRYAAIMAASRRKAENGEELDEMDYSHDEKITLRGGLSHNGRPAELVREKNGKVIPLAEGAEDIKTGFSSSTSSSSKRALSDDEMDDDEVKRSMARRRKSDKPGDVMHVCRDCKKEFKRPCDLTKHEKTHSRPWKCTEEKCKYFELGWPTEKERDRHINDKHSAAPPQYKCLYPPCSYASKRESNCKQHMEKAHGWEYVRSKSNGRKKNNNNQANHGSERSPTTPLTPFLGTPQSVALQTPVTPVAPSPSIPMMDNFDYPYGFGTPAMSVGGFQDDFRRDSVTTDGSVLTYSSGQSPPEQTSFEDAVTPEDAPINHDDVFSNCTLSTNFNHTFQQPTPAMSTGFDFSPLPFTSAPANVPHLSPGGQADMTLFSPHVQLDEGFGEGMDSMFARPTEDFQLFPTTTQGNNMNINATTGFFQDMNSFGGQFDNNLYAEPTTTLDDLMGFSNPQ